MLKDNKFIVNQWFRVWEIGNSIDLPLHESFKHHSPYGVVDGKQTYLDIISESEHLFLGNRLTVHDEIFGDTSACVRYTMESAVATMEVSEWFYFQDGLIKEIIAYYDKSDELLGGRGLDI